MRRIKKDELKKLSNFMVEQYFEKEELQKNFEGIEEEKAKQTAKELTYLEMKYFFENGDIYIYDDNITAAIIGIEHKKISMIKMLPSVFKINKILSKLSKEETKKMKENKKILYEVQDSKWFKKYCKNPYYCTQFAIEKSKRGKGIAREMLEFLFDNVKAKNDYIMLETLTAEYVSIYEHFGFELQETSETKNKEITQYRMIKKLNI